MELLSHKHSSKETPRAREILAFIKQCTSDQVKIKEIKQTYGLFSVHQKCIESVEIPFYFQPYNSFCMLMEKVPDYLMEIFPEIDSAISNMVF